MIRDFWGTTVVLSGIFPFTTAFAPILTLFPIWNGDRILAPAPIRQLSPISPPSLDRYLLGNYAVSADFGLLADNNPVQSMKQNRRLGELCSLVDISGKRGIVIRIASFDVIEVVIFQP